MRWGRGESDSLVFQPQLVEKGTDHASLERNLSEGNESARARTGRGGRRHQALRDLTRGSGAESIDFLDITFRLEREFGIKIPLSELFLEPASRDAQAFTRDGRPTDEGLAALRLLMPYADLRELERDRRLNRIDDLFTVDLVASYIRWRLGGSGAAETDAHAPAFHHSPEDPTLDVCFVSP